MNTVPALICLVVHHNAFASIYTTSSVQTRMWIHKNTCKQGRIHTDIMKCISYSNDTYSIDIGTLTHFIVWMQVSFCRVRGANLYQIHVSLSKFSIPGVMSVLFHQATAILVQTGNIYGESVLGFMMEWSFWQHFMMTSSNGNIFCVTGPLCGEFTGHRWIPITKASDV